MASKFSGKIYFCGKMRKFKRCPNKVLKNYQKSVENYQNKLYPLAESNRDFQFKMDETVPTCRSLKTPLAGYDKATFQYYMIDGFIVSNNVTVNEIHTLDLGFKNTDHNPVSMNIKLN